MRQTTARRRASRRSRWPRPSAFRAAPLLAALLALTAGPAVAQTTADPTLERIEARTYWFDEAGTEVEYARFIPSSYDPTQPTPLIVVLHGLGSNAGQVIRYQGLTALAEERGYIVVSPMGYNSRGWYGSWGPSGLDAPGVQEGDPENLGELSELDVMNVLDRTLSELNVDRDRIFLMGHSMGGGGTWHLAIKYPELWAGLGPVAPAIWRSPDELEAIPHVPVIIIHGDDDQLVPVDTARQWVAKMEELGMTHRYVEIAGGDHTGIIARDPDNMRAIFDFFDGVDGARARGAARGGVPGTSAARGTTIER